MKVWKTLKKHIWLSIALLSSAVLLLIWFSFIKEEQVNTFFSSDALYLPSIYKDIFMDGGSLNGWTLNPAPNFIPDMFFFFLLMGITSGNFIVSSFIFSVVQYFTIIGLFYLLLKKIVPQLNSAVFTIAVYLFSLFLFVFLIDQNFYLSYLINSNSYHNGMFVMVLLCLFLSIKLIKPPSWGLLVTLFLIIFLSSISDMLFAIGFSIPFLLVLISLYVLKFERKTIFKLFIALLFGTVLGLYLFHLIKYNSIFQFTKPYGKFDLENILMSWQIFSEQLYSYLKTFSVIQIIIVLSIFAYLGCIYSVGKQFFHILKKKQLVSLSFIFELFVFFFTPIVLLAPVLNGSYGGDDCIRYNYYVFIILLFYMVVLLSRVLAQRKQLLCIVNGAMFLSICIFIIVTLYKHNLGVGLKRYFTTYPEKAQLLDAAFANSSKAVYGIAEDYWSAKQTTMFSKKDIRLYSTFDDAVPYFHVANSHWFFGADKGKYAHPKFTFLWWKAEKELPELFKEANPPIEAIRYGEYILYKVRPFSYNKKTLKPYLLE